MNEKVIGIIGGMGPEATANLYLKIIKNTKVSCDQEHFRVVIDGNAKIPDRTAAIKGDGISPVDAIVETGKNLEQIGADVLCIPCITSHYFLEDIQKELEIPILNAISVLGDYIRTVLPDISKVGVLATDGTVSTNLYAKYLDGFQVIYPDKEYQNGCVMESIYGAEGIKNGFLTNKNRELLKRAGHNLISKGAEVIIAGCTEIGLVLERGDLDRRIIDPMDTLALKLVEEN